jgi:nucleotide-binding universal stress UspA family protein
VPGQTRRRRDRRPNRVLQNPDLLLFSVEPDALAAGTVPESITGALNDAPCDVALALGRRGEATDSSGLPVLVPFGGAEHDWAALELGAWFASACGVSLRLLGLAELPTGASDASRLLADASLAIQQLLGVAAEPVLAPGGSEGVLAAARDCGLLVVGLPETWRQELLGNARSLIAAHTQLPVLFVRRGVRPGGLAPDESLTRFTWSLAAARS